MESIRALLKSVHRRQQLQWVWQCCSWGLIVGGAFSCATSLIQVIAGNPFSFGAAWLPIVAAPLFASLISILFPRRLSAAAVAVDRVCELKDRVKTAFRFITELQSLGPIRELQIADAAEHLTKIDPVQVAPLRAPKSWLWGLVITAMAIIAGIVSSPSPRAEAKLVTNDVVSAQALRVANELEELREVSKRESSPEIEKLLKELATKIEQLRQPGVDPKEALAKLSEMEAALQEQQQQLTKQDVEAALKAVGEAMSLAPPLQAAGEAISHGELEKAAEDLPKLDLPNLDRKTEIALAEKLNQQAKNNLGNGSQKALREALEQLSQGLTQGDRNRFKEGLQGLARECRKQSQRKKLCDMLRKQCQCLCECKGECENECKNEGESNKKGGSKWGLARSGNHPGEKTAKLKTSPEMKLKGQESASGDSDIETQKDNVKEQTAVRQYREQSKKYEQLAESALEAEPIPLGHRQTIRRYFELIRPKSAETDAIRSTSTKY